MTPPKSTRRPDVLGLLAPLVFLVVAQVTGQKETLFDLQQRLAEQIVEGLEVIQDVQRAAPGSRLVSATFSPLQDRALDSGRDRLTNEVERRIGGRLGGLFGDREPDPAPAPC